LLLTNLWELAAGLETIVPISGNLSSSFSLWGYTLFLLMMYSIRFRFFCSFYSFSCFSAITAILAFTCAYSFCFYLSW
jgi:hypothetical protein